MQYCKNKRFSKVANIDCNSNKDNENTEKTLLAITKLQLAKHIDDDLDDNIDTDKAARHRHIDSMLLAIINDDELTKLFHKMFKYYI